MNSKNSSLSRRNGTAMIQPKLNVSGSTMLQSRNKIGAGLMNKTYSKGELLTSRFNKTSAAKFKGSFVASDSFASNQMPQPQQLVSARNVTRPAMVVRKEAVRAINSSANIEPSEKASEHLPRDTLHKFRYFAQASDRYAKPGKVSQ